MRCFTTIVFTIFLVPNAFAGRYDAFETVCASKGGILKTAATGYSIPEEKSSVGVARCALKTGSKSYVNGDLISLPSLSVFDPSFLDDFAKSCSGKIYVSAIPDVFGSVSHMSVRSSLVVVCY